MDDDAQMSQVDAREFRSAAGQYMTGVTVITTVDADGNPAGLTANSFGTVSLHPPMVLWCIGKDSTNLEAFEAGHGFAIHVLASERQDQAQRFATKGIDRFDGVAWTPGFDGAPVLEDALAVFECSRTHTYDGGDHLIYVGTVEKVTMSGNDRPALGYFRSRYISHG